ncbi:MAG: LPS export ABC transporter periplasmic protein LptC [Acidaminococcaceae bacterium]|nr:LPS export ABC transporter periplasmic protein LptC [Acidaminococcaceae bacterium]MBR1590010.1 LPS export ABC transporter periplasmic protein LptC [Acidaminococcaceae bacterium]
MKNKKTVTAIAVGLAVLLMVVGWLFWGAEVPEPTDKTKKENTGAVQATVHNTVLDHSENGKKLWNLKVGEVTQIADGLVNAKDLDGVVYLSNGDEIYLKAAAGQIRIKEEQFALSRGVTVRLKNGGFLKADEVAWDRKKDILTAAGSVKVVKDDMLARAEKVITSSKLEHFKLTKQAHVERGGHYEEQ